MEYYILRDGALVSKGYYDKICIVLKRTYTRVHGKPCGKVRVTSFSEKIKWKKYSFNS